MKPHIKILMSFLVFLFAFVRTHSQGNDSGKSKVANQSNIRNNQVNKGASASRNEQKPLVNHAPNVTRAGKDTAKGLKDTVKKGAQVAGTKPTPQFTSPDSSIKKKNVVLGTSKKGVVNEDAKILDLNKRIELLTSSNSLIKTLLFILLGFFLLLSFIAFHFYKRSLALSAGINQNRRPSTGNDEVKKQTVDSFVIHNPTAAIHVQEKNEFQKGIDRITEGLTLVSNSYPKVNRDGGDINSGPRTEVGKSLPDNNKKDDLSTVPPPVEAPSGEERVFTNYSGKQGQSYIKSEIMVSAGPRKESGTDDTELGEDVAGSLSLPDQTFFWLLDGTSESALIKGTSDTTGDSRQEQSHIFSSRLLAQNIANYIQKNIFKSLDGTTSLEKLLDDARDQVLDEWVKRINNESPEKKSSIISVINKGLKPLCSTTVIIGRYETNGRLHVLRTGDSKVFPFIGGDDGNLILDKTFKFTRDPSEENDRVAFRLDYNEQNDQFTIKSNEHRWLCEVTENVVSAFAFSDGIGRMIETQLSSNNAGIVEMIKDNISRIQQKTYDDKALIILSRILNS
jgi:hypothetical protein